jgi:glutamate decarboxylase
MTSSNSQAAPEAQPVVKLKTLEEVSQHFEDYSEPAFASRFFVNSADKHEFPKSGMPARVAQQLIRDARMLDANPRLNLASFVTTWMEPECDELIHEARNVNYIDEAEYPSSTEIQNNCVAMLADLFHADDPQHPTGTATIGSSEAILLGGLALKRRWQDRRKAEGKPTDKPNIVMGSEIHVCWEKLTNYFEIEARYVNLTDDCFVATPEKLAAQVDENTIGVAAVLGTTYTGAFEDVETLDKLIGEINEKNGWNVGIHVDGASGAFVAPFLYPDLKWDFRLANVVSINASGHKFGLVYPGLGWCIFKNKDCLPDSLVFHDNYLGIDQISFTLNFSKSAAPIVAQYYQFLRLGRPGYLKLMQNMHAVTGYLSKRINDLNHFRVVSDDVSLPLVAFSLTPGEDGKERGYTAFDIADRLRERGWVVPAYTLAPGAEHIRVLRVLCREDFSVQSADMFVNDLKMALDWLDAHFIYTPEQIKQLEAKYDKQVPLGPHGSARPNQQTIADLKEHPSPQALPSHPERKARKLERLLSKTALT